MIGCNSKCSSDCFVDKITAHLKSYPTELFNIIDSNKILKVSEITVRASQVEEQINQLLYSILIEMKYSSTKFSIEAFSIIDENFSLWQLWFKEITLFHKNLICKNIKCQFYPDVLISLAIEIKNTYTKRLEQFKLGQLFLKAHEQVFQEFCQNLRKFSLNNAIEENIFEIGRYLLINLETSIAEVLSIDSFERGENIIYILPRVVRLKLNYIKLIWNLYKKPFKLKFFTFDAIIEEKVMKLIQQANLEDFLIN